MRWPTPLRLVVETETLTFFSITEVPTPAVSGTSSISSKSTSKLMCVPLANWWSKLSRRPVALALSHCSVVKVLVTAMLPSVMVKVLSLPLPPAYLMTTLSKLPSVLLAKPEIVRFWMPRSRSALAMSLASALIAPSPVMSTT